MKTFLQLLPFMIIFGIAVYQKDGNAFRIVVLVLLIAILVILTSLYSKKQNGSKK